jgi:alkaline phosphatase D
VAVCVALLASACALLPSPRPPARAAPAGAALSLGPIAFDVGEASAVLWARASGPARLVFALDPAAARAAIRDVGPESDFTARVVVDGLLPDTEYRVHVRVEGGTGAEGRFRTAPDAASLRSVRVAWGGDLAGQNVCRDEVRGFPVFEGVSHYAPDLFIGLGDMIYADYLCQARGLHGNAQIPGGYGLGIDLESYRAHWRYTREDPAFARVLATTPYVAIWDDHEVVNDFGPLHDTRSRAPYTAGVHLLPIGLRTFLEYNAVAVDALRTPDRLYRSLRFGRHVELFILDTRQYRDANLAPDLAPAEPDELGEVRRHKTLLGREQRVWLEHALLASNATWKVIVSSVPLAIPTGWPRARGRDGWAPGAERTGFARERDEILRFLFANGLRSTVWITTDVHFAQVLTHHPVAEDSGFRVIEAVSGPLSAGLGTAGPVDPALRPEVLFVHAVPDRAPLASFEAAMRYFNFGALELDATGVLTVRILDVAGGTLFAERFEPGG